MSDDERQDAIREEIRIASNLIASWSHPSGVWSVAGKDWRAPVAHDLGIARRRLQNAIDLARSR